MAFSDIDGLDGYSTGDVLIARLMDTSGNTLPGPGDTIEMGRYPTNLDATAFGDWLDKSHAVASAVGQFATRLDMKDTNDDIFSWRKDDLNVFDGYVEYPSGTGAPWSRIEDSVTVTPDRVWVEAGSPSAPLVAVPEVNLARATDDPFIDVVLNYPVP